ncbi:hypothetical protein M885DRAFT_521632 [Pelagophyceae sp. CCMP2097]|nr:hypothetical protein M885DRAFT_521632 [Pelagophyceae sp. CCMP2097]
MAAAARLVAPSQTAAPFQPVEAEPLQEYTYAPAAGVVDPFGAKRRPASARPASGAYAGPVRVVCYLCGQSAGSRSIGFHHQKCLAKWDSKRGPLPFPPESSPAPRRAGPALDAYNAEAKHVAASATRNGGYLEGSHAADTFRHVCPPAPKPEWIRPDAVIARRDEPAPPPPPRKTARPQRPRKCPSFPQSPRKGPFAIRGAPRGRRRASGRADW